MSASGDYRTEERRQVLLKLLFVHGPDRGLPLSTMLSLLRSDKWFAQWPRSDVTGARNDIYDGGIRQHLTAMVKRNHLISYMPDANVNVLWYYVPDSMEPRLHAREVRDLKAKGMSNEQIATRLGLKSKGLVSAIANDPYGLREKERKRKYCPGCGEVKKEEESQCPGCVRRRRERAGDEAEALLPLPEYVDRIRGRLLLKVDFCVDEEHRRILVLYTERGRAERLLARGEDWEHALEDSGALRA